VRTCAACGRTWRSGEGIGRSALSLRRRHQSPRRCLRPLARSYGTSKWAPSSVVEHVTFNHVVLGSIPRGPTS
jgi:hypothetical protein